MIIDEIKKTVNGGDISTRDKYRILRTKLPDLPSDKVLQKQFGSFKLFKEAYYNGKQVQTKTPVKPKPVLPKDDDIDIEDEPAKRPLMAKGNNYTAAELKFLKIVDAYRETNNINFPTLVELFRMARQSLGLKDEHEDQN